MTSSLTRRDLLAACTAAALGMGRGLPAVGQVDDAAPVLRLLCWSGIDDQRVTRAFREATGFAVAADTVGSNDEFFTFLRAGGASRYDIVTPADGIVAGLTSSGLIQPLDAVRLPTIGSLYPRFRAPSWAMADGSMMAVPYLWGRSPLVYNSGRLAQPPELWSDLLDEAYRGRIAMTDDVLGTFLVWNRVLGATNPARVTRDELAATMEAVSALKRQNASIFSGSMGDLRRGMVTGRAYVTTPAWEGVPLLDGHDEAQFTLALPSPGGASFAQNLAIPSDAPNPDAAHAFIESILQPATQAQLMSIVVRGTVHPEAVPLLDPAVSQPFGYANLDAVFAESPIYGFPPLGDSGEGIATYVDWVVAWDSVRTTPLEWNRTRTPTPEPSRPES